MTPEAPDWTTSFRPRTLEAPDWTISFRPRTLEAPDTTHLVHPKKEDTHPNGTHEQSRVAWQLPHAGHTHPTAWRGQLARLRTHPNVHSSHPIWPSPEEPVS